MRFNPACKRDSHFKSEWPDLKESKGELFTARPSLRKLVVLVDNELFVEDTAAWNKESLLSGLLTHPYIRMVRYTDGALPPTATKMHSPWSGEFVPGWAILRPRHKETNEIREFVVANDETATIHAIYGNAALIARSDSSHPAYSDLPADEAAGKREADAIAARVAEEISADIYITRREYLTESPTPRTDNTSVCTPGDAVPLVGLFLRRQGVFMYFRSVDGGFQFNCSQRIYFFTGAMDLLPSAWRWSNACGQSAEATGDDGLAALSSSLVQRVERALQSRDDLFFALNTVGNRDSTDAALRSLDTALIFLMGAIDVSARVAHRVLQISLSQRNAGWQNPAWLQRVQLLAPGLAAIFNQGSDAQHLLEILRKFRNSVHGEALSPLTLSEGSKPERILVGLPREDLKAILDSMDALGGRSAWGVESPWENRMYSDPGILLDNILRRALVILNEIMHETPVEMLPDVRITPAACEPPSDPHGRYSEMKREGIRWQLGF